MYVYRYVCMYFCMCVCVCIVTYTHISHTLACRRARSKKRGGGFTSPRGNDGGKASVRRRNQGQISKGEVVNSESFFYFFASQTLHTRKFPKLHLGEVPFLHFVSFLHWKSID